MGEFFHVMSYWHCQWISELQSLNTIESRKRLKAKQEEDEANEDGEINAGTGRKRAERQMFKNCDQDLICSQLFSIIPDGSDLH
uniref:Uncharacterized protein n=1 Tax=Tetranychus urticae TaxID=32264 RepID=T1K2K9_TETUR